MLNRRSHVRRSLSVPGILTSGSAETAAIILDMSSHGARVRLSSGLFLARDCTLRSPAFAEAIPSRVVWRHKTEIGLRFKTVVTQRVVSPRNGMPAGRGASSS